jgi:hypothetical protein
MWKEPSLKVGRVRSDVDVALTEGEILKKEGGEEEANPQGREEGWKGRYEVG